MRDIVRRAESMPYPSRQPRLEAFIVSTTRNIIIVCSAERYKVKSATFFNLM